MSKKFRLACWAFVFLLIWGLGFYCGRSYLGTTTKIDTVYVKGKTVTDTISKEKLVPYKVYTPIDTANVIAKCVEDGIYYELFPDRGEIQFKYITQYIEPTKEDTTAIMRDWAAKRFYNQTLFDTDTLGVCTINAEVQYNRLEGLNYTFTPTVREITKTVIRTKNFSPFVGVGGSVNTDANKNFYGGISAGAFIKEKIGFQLQYQRDFKDNKNLVGGQILFKF